MRIALLLTLAVISAGTASMAVATDAPVPAGAQVRYLDTVVVSGRQPGPGLWRVSNGDHDLWILGTVAPVPERMEWYSPKTEAVLAQSQEIIGQPGIAASLSAGGMFRAAFAMPTMLRTRKNPDGKTLRDVLPPDLYTRWSSLKAIYLGKDKAVESWRPIFAAGHLYQAALERAGLVFSNGVEKRIAKLEDKHDIKRTSTVSRHEIRDPKRLAKSFAASEIDDVACFRNMLDRLELDVVQAAERANAWAVGDIGELRRLIARDELQSCFDAIANTEAARSMGMDQSYQQSEARWIAAATAALVNNRTSFAVLPVRKLLDPDGPLASLQAKGYTVLAPE
jgi:hypothetical protein